jgi:hypothetical protein
MLGKLGIGVDEYIDEIRALLGTLNALACANVTTERVAPKRAHLAMRPSFQFDTYHVLVVKQRDSVRSSVSEFVEDRRSPREHLRRGHIRRHQSGLRLWINATVVNAGVGGKVSKDYAVR